MKAKPLCEQKTGWGVHQGEYCIYCTLAKKDKTITELNSQIKNLNKKLNAYKLDGFTGKELKNENHKLRAKCEEKQAMINSYQAIIDSNSFIAENFKEKLEYLYEVCKNLEVKNNVA